MISNKLFTHIFPKNHLKTLAFFSKRKGLQQNIKSKQTKKLPENQTQQTTSAEGLLQISKMKLLNMQFFPASLLISPTILSVNEMFDPNFLLGELLVEKYCSLALLMNLDFQNDKRKAAFFFVTMASLHTLTGLYSIGTPLGMAMLTIFAPFKFSKQKEKYNQIESYRISNMSNIKIVYFFIFVLLTTVKAMHFEATSKLDTKLKTFDQQNLAITKKDKTNV